MTVACYTPVFLNGYIWDDDSYVTQNENIRTFDGLKRIWLVPSSSPQYYPMVFTSYWLEYKVFGLNPLAYHMTNLILHILSSIVLWKILTLLDTKGAWYAACIFAIHPVNVESVAWITERKNILSGLFFLLALLLFILPIVKEGMAEHKKGNSMNLWIDAYYPLSLLCFIVALLSKTTSCSLPVVIIILLWRIRGKVHKRDIYLLVPFFAIGVIMGLNTLWIERNRVGAFGPDFDFNILERTIIAGRAVWFYILKLLWPYPLIFIYPRWDIDASVWWQYIYPLSSASIILLLYFLYRYNRVGNGMLVCILIFGVMLFPALGFFNVYPFLFSFVADHFQYLASAAVIVLFVSIFETNSFFINKLPFFYYDDNKSAISLSVYFIIFLSLGIITWHQTHIYKDLVTLWSDTVKKNPSAWIAHNNLGVELGKNGDAEGAFLHYKTALKLRPNYVEALINLGALLVESGKVSEGIIEYKKALEINPSNEKTYNNLGVAFALQGKLKEAVFYFQQAVALNSSYSIAKNNLRSILKDIKK